MALTVILGASTQHEGSRHSQGPCTWKQVQGHHVSPRSPGTGGLWGCWGTCAKSFLYNKTLQAYPKQIVNLNVGLPGVFSSAG